MWIWAAFWVATAGAVVPAPEDSNSEKLTRIAVLPPKLLRGSRATIDPALLNEALLTALHNAGDFEVIGQSDMNAVLGFERQKEILGCDDSECFVEIGGALGVEYLLDTKVGRSASRWHFTTKVIELGGGRPLVVARNMVHVPGDPEELLDALPYVIREVLVDAQLPISADREVSAPAGAPLTMQQVLASARSDAARIAPCMSAGYATGELRPGIHEMFLHWVVDPTGRVRLASVSANAKLVGSSIPACFGARLRLQVFPRLAPEGTNQATFVPYLSR